MSRSRSAALALIGVPAAFALGCLPSANIVSRVLGGSDIAEVGDHKPGAANVTRSLGLGPGIATAAIDIGKGAAVAAVARRLGAGRNLTGVLAAAPVAAHIGVVRGRGAAAALGAAFALDAPATAMVLVPILGGTAAKKAGLGVMVGALCLPLASAALGRRTTAAWCAALPALVAYGRIRGSDGDTTPLTARVAWSRFWFDQGPRVEPGSDKEQP